MLVIVVTVLLCFVKSITPTPMSLPNGKAKDSTTVHEVATKMNSTSKADFGPEEKMKEKILQLQKDCNLDPDTGRCKASHQRYHYNSTSNECELFTYGGCGGNANNFYDKETCEDWCQANEVATNHNVNNEAPNEVDGNIGLPPYGDIGHPPYYGDPIFDGQKTNNNNKVAGKDNENNEATAKSIRKPESSRWIPARDRPAQQIRPPGSPGPRTAKQGRSPGAPGPRTNEATGKAARTTI